MRPNIRPLLASRASFVAWLAALAFSILFARIMVAADSTKRPPNILIILTDDQGRGDYSAFGTKDIDTPNIDRLFNEGMTFDNFYANSSVCSPSRAALLSGCYPDRVGVPGVIREEDADESWGYLSAHATLLPELLKRAGYHTALVGKWHLGISSPNLPNERGFDLFDGFLGDMMDDYWTHLRHGYNFMRHNSEIVSPKGHATDVFTDGACRYLRERSKSSQPFFLYLAYNAPHDPIQPRPDWLAKVQRREPRMSPRRARLVALIEHLDSGIGQVLDMLDKTHLAENTLVMFSSDNGGVLANGANNGPWRGDKGHMYEGGLRVPFAARWPGHIEAGSSSSRIALTMDMFPTALAAAGISPPPGIDGVSILPTFLSQAEPPLRQFHYFVRREGGIAYGGKTIEALRLGDWKLLQDTPYAPLELYNLSLDPRETTDLSAKNPPMRAKLDILMRKQIQIGGATPWQSPRTTTKGVR